MPQNESHGALTWGIAIVAAVGNDIIDYTGAGMIPLAGDVIDIISTAALYPVAGPMIDLLTLSELIPGIDALPVHTAALVAAYLWK